MSEPILSLRGVSQIYSSRNASGWGWTTIRAVDDVDLDIREGETLAVVGESGSGKSTLAKLLLMLNDPTHGEVAYRGASLAKLGRAKRNEYRRQVQAVFQDPASSLNPRMTVEQTLGYVIRRHGIAAPSDQRAFIVRQLASVGLTPPEQYLSRYPHQLSGGQQQRIAIARAMMLEPKIIIADEPLSSLDVSIQAQVLQLMQDLRRRTNVGFVVISHDLGAMQSIADRTAVMYRGRIVEIGQDIYSRPVHPYTQLLLDARLMLDPRGGRIRAMAAVQAAPSKQSVTGTGCRFRDRCPYAVEICDATDPALRKIDDGSTLAACHRTEELAAGSIPAKKSRASTAIT
ncbi:MAG TPA: oligopeptide/dipeptide ABC transporter ATP-binding protein [Rhizobiaceae bacterium]|nr:oligopeptide/dipeptide ABC transporter ATP-binding protein [Rhizobiaceae bacterium]